MLAVIVPANDPRSDADILSRYDLDSARIIRTGTYLAGLEFDSCIIDKLAPYTLADQICDSIRLSQLESVSDFSNGELLRRLKARQANQPPQGPDERSGD